MTEELTLTPLDTQFAALMVKLNGHPDPDLERTAVMVSAWRAAGHICVPLDSNTAERLRRTAVVGEPGEFKPLILDQCNRLYLHRYWTYENELASAIQQRLRTTVEVNETLLADGLQRVHQSDDQRRAAETAVRNNFAVITGGPGTGKTRTVIVLLALLIDQFAARGQKVRMALTAPTGKAAARMKESVQRMADLKEFATIRSALPQDATTVHRLLGVIPDSPDFRHNAERPLAVDAVILDEASMVDLALMAKLFAAVPRTARIVLLGDKDQLASVEAGNVLGDICGRMETGARIREHIVELRENFRFQYESGIRRLSEFVNAGDASGALEVLESRAYQDVSGVPLPGPQLLPNRLRERILSGFRRCVEEADPAVALKEFSRFRVLCALRRGPYGVENLNRIAEQALGEAGLIEPAVNHYRGQPVLVLANDYNMKLFNGDVGLILPDSDAGGELRAFFYDVSGVVRRFPPSRLPPHETVFAMTVHKSQGSEFDEVLLVLPDKDHPVVTRELIYTAVTRASGRVELWYREAALRCAISRRVERTSGLRDALWEPRELKQLLLF